MRERALIIIGFIILALFALGFDQFDKYLERHATETGVIELSSHGPDISHCLLPENDTWNCIKNGEYRKHMFRTDI